jgi:Tfp pilus assembly protein PilF
MVSPVSAFLLVWIGWAQASPIPVPPAEATAAFERGRRLYEGGTDLRGARSALDQAIALRPDYAEAYLYRALVTQEDHGLSGARADYEFALKLDPGAKETHRYFGEALADAGEIEPAEARYRRALELDPAYADVMYLLAKLLRAKGQQGAAVLLLERHAALEPKGTAHHVLGEIFLEQGNDARAKEEFEEDLERDDTCYPSRINLAGLLAAKGDVEGARTHYQRSLELHPADARALEGLGKAYLALGDHELAVGTLRQALLLSPKNHVIEEALDAARLRLRLRYGWPFAVLPACVALALALMLRKRRA